MKWVGFIQFSFSLEPIKRIPGSNQMDELNGNTLYFSQKKKEGWGEDYRDKRRRTGKWMDGWMIEERRGGKKKK